jgi:hypothetical protein
VSYGHPGPFPGDVKGLIRVAGEVQCTDRGYRPSYGTLIEKHVPLECLSCGKRYTMTRSAWLKKKDCSRGCQSCSYRALWPNRYAPESACVSEGCGGTALSGSKKCPDCLKATARKCARDAVRKRRERLADAKDCYPDLTHLDNGTCYICGTTEGPFQVEHVVPLDLWESHAANGLTESGLRLACKACNGPSGKWNKEPAEYILYRFRNGLPIVQASGDPEARDVTLVPHSPLTWRQNGPRDD